MTERAFLTLQVAARRDEAGRVAVFDLVAPDGAALPEFTAGAHVELVVEPGKTRCYSLYGDPADSSRYRLAVLREENGRGGSCAVHELARPGAVISVSTPRNAFPLQENAPHTLLIAGGIGVTPLLAMAARLKALGRSFELHLCCRSRGASPLLEAVAAVAAERAHLHLDDEGIAQRLDAAALAACCPEGTQAYVCGPEGFMQAVTTALRTHLPTEAIHTESFAPVAGRSGDEAFTLRLARAGIDIEVPPGVSMLEALSGAGVEVETSCEQGMCGVCVTRVLEGQPDHRDYYLSPAERERGDVITPCCSRSLSALIVLDL